MTNRRLRLNLVLSFSYLQLPVHLVEFPVLWLAGQTARREKIQRFTGTIRPQMIETPARHDFSDEAHVAIHVQQLDLKEYSLIDGNLYSIHLNLYLMNNISEVDGNKNLLENKHGAD